MEDAAAPTTSQPDVDANGEELPPGNHPLEVAARRGFGPLSQHAQQEWHGQSRPCVSCGQLVLRNGAACDFCGQDMRPEMLDKMRAHAGPWYVLEHVRPFPGVSLERIVRQIRRGLITETSIVRGPATDHQWRFAAETPGLCRYFGRCWHCRQPVAPSDANCQSCMSFLSFEQAKPMSPIPTGQSQAIPCTPPRNEQATQGASRVPMPAPDPGPVDATGSEPLRRLSAALNLTELPTHESLWDEPPRVGGIRATWIAAGLLVVVVVALLLYSNARSNATAELPAAPGMLIPDYPDSPP